MGVPEQEFNNVTVSDLGNNTFSARFSNGGYIEAQEANDIISVFPPPKLLPRPDMWAAEEFQWRHIRSPGSTIRKPVILCMRMV